jgi:subtilase family serine protease
MQLNRLFLSVSAPALALLAITSAASQPAVAATPRALPLAVQQGIDQGRVASDKVQTLTVFLNLHNKAEYDKQVEALYDPASPTFHKWFTDADFAKYAPTAAELKTVTDELRKQGFTVVSTDPHNFSVRVKGTTSVAERAFNTELHTINYKGVTFQASIGEGKPSGPAGDLIDTVAGLERHQVKSLVSLASNPFTKKPLVKQPIQQFVTKQSLLKEITSIAITAPVVSVFSTPGASIPVGIYYGNTFDAAYTAKPGDPQTVSYTPSQLQSHYGLTSLITQGYDGTGQTIALLEAYGYSNDISDANVAAQIFGLPQLTSSNFAVVFPDGKPFLPNAGYDAGWNTEIALDIQSAHAIAPGAKIIEVDSNGQDDEDFISAMNYIISHKLANVVSDSWETDGEYYAGPAEVAAFTAVLEKAAAAGISFQFSSGDGGDGGLGTPIGAVGVPADSPYATAVGGTSILNDPSTSGQQIVTGWGDDFSYLVLPGYGPTDPPNSSEFSFFAGGAGGGESVYSAKPSWQKSLPGSGRQVPDVSALADPYTGFTIVYSQLGIGGTIAQYGLPGVGGTSLASPIFTAIWAIADQYNGKPLGFAAPAIAKLKTGDITDVLPVSDLNLLDATGTVYDTSGATFYSADGLFEYASTGQTQTEFPSAIFNIAPGEAVGIAFGLDSSLTVTKGWDNVTGFGEPNGLPFIQGVTGKTKGAALAK